MTTLKYIVSLTCNSRDCILGTLSAILYIGEKIADAG